LYCKTARTHAGREGLARAPTQGFCIFNNVAIGAIYASEKYKVCILDIDLHHGNGTEDIVAYKDNIIYISIHAKKIYPGTGYESYANIYNFPLDPGIDNKIYIETVDKVFKIIESYRPDLILVSLGFDAHMDDPLSVFNIDLEPYKYVFEKLKEYWTIFVLEGGYNLKVLYEGSCTLYDIFVGNRG